MTAAKNTVSIYDKLAFIQAELKVPKANYNEFGRYSYRSAEDIEAAVKPLLKSVGAILILSDEIVAIADRIYVKATAIIQDMVAAADGTHQEIHTCAYAREAQAKKGMDDSQITGSASSYARKYALGGLFLIDDVKDSDATNKHDDEPTKKPTEKESKAKRQKMIERIKALVDECTALGINLKLINRNVTDINEMPDDELMSYGIYLAQLKKSANEGEEDGE